MVVDTVSELGPPLYRYFASSFAPAHAADLTQESLLRLLEKCRDGKFDPSKGSLRMYAFGIAHFVRLEHFKEISFLEVPETAAPDDGWMERLTLRQAIVKLPEGERQVVLLLFDRDLSLAEIGHILELPLNTVKSHVHRAKLKLKEILSQEGSRHG